jgi:hypothetical protein
MKPILAAIGKNPLYGHKSGRQSKTQWLAFAGGRSGSPSPFRSTVAAAVLLILAFASVAAIRSGTGRGRATRVMSPSADTRHWRLADEEE